MPKRGKAYIGLIVIVFIYFVIYFYLMGPNIVNIWGLIAESGASKRGYKMDTAIMGAYETNLNELKSMVFDDISIIESENLASSVTYIKSLADRNRLKKVEIKLEGVEDMEAGPMEGIGKLYCNQVYVFAEGSYLDIIGYINDIQKNGDRYYLSGLDIRSEYDYYEAEISINIYTYITNPIENRPKMSAEK